MRNVIKNPDKTKKKLTPKFPFSPIEISVLPICDNSKLG
jgi:hypothetical protein